MRSVIQEQLTSAIPAATAFADLKNPANHVVPGIPITASGDLVVHAKEYVSVMFPNNSTLCAILMEPQQDVMASASAFFSNRKAHDGIVFLSR